MFVYHVFLLGAEAPVWTYKTWRGLFAKLRELAVHTSVSKVRVEYRQRFGPSTKYDLGERVEVGVEFVRGVDVKGWQTPVGQGIRHGELGCMSAWSRSGWAGVSVEREEVAHG